MRRILLEQEENAVFYRQYFTSVYLQTEIINNLTLKYVRALTPRTRIDSWGTLGFMYKRFLSSYQKYAKIEEEMNSAFCKSNPITPTDFTAET